MTLRQTVAANLLHMRIQRRMSQSDLALAARLSVSYVSMLERGLRSPPLETLARLSEALIVKPHKLLE